MAGSSFFRARSPVTPNITSTHGPATRGMRRSRASRRGLNPRWYAAGPTGVIIRLLPCSLAISWPARAVGLHFPLDRVEQLMPGGGELGDALLLQHRDDVVVVDAEPVQL